MSFLKRFFNSTPVVLIFGLAVIVFGFIAVFAFLLAVSYYIEISISIGFVIFISVLIYGYTKFRKPDLVTYDWSSISQKENNLTNTKLWNEEFKLIVVSGVLVSILTVGNYWTGYIAGPIILFIYGVYCLVLIYLMDKGRINSRPEQSIKLSDPRVRGQTGIPRVLINYSIILALASIFWAFQIQKNESRLKQDGYTLLNELSNLKYCQEFQSRCVAIDKINSVQFKKIAASGGPGKTWEMCFSLNYEYSRFGGYYESDYRFEDFCFSKENYGNSWSQSDIENEIYRRLKQLAN